MLNQYLLVDWLLACFQGWGAAVTSEHISRGRKHTTQNPEQQGWPPRHVAQPSGSAVWLEGFSEDHCRDSTLRSVPRGVFLRLRMHALGS